MHHRCFDAARCSNVIVILPRFNRRRATFLESGSNRRADERLSRSDIWPLIPLPCCVAVEMFLIFPSRPLHTPPPPHLRPAHEVQPSHSRKCHHFRPAHSIVSKAERLISNTSLVSFGAGARVLHELRCPSEQSD